jgi:hypothetical protein
MITGDEAVFPNNCVTLLATRFGLIDEEVNTFRRPLKMSDPSIAIGVFGSLWMPDPESYELNQQLGGSPIPGSSEPSVSRYVCGIQAFVKDFDEEIGLARHSVLSTMVRGILYRDAALRVALSQLNVEVSGVRERTLRWGVTAQRFLNNELGDNEWLYLSSIEFWLDTEIY